MVMGRVLITLRTPVRITCGVCCLDPLAYGTQTFVAGLKPTRRLLPNVAVPPQITAPLTLSLIPAAQALSSASTLPLIEDELPQLLIAPRTLITT
jgi:hypothetical protein